MRAAVWHGRRHVRIDNVPDSTIRDHAVIRIPSIVSPDAHEYPEKKQGGAMNVVFRP